MEHAVSSDCLQRFAAGAATREEGRTIALHLLKGCPTCAATLRNLNRERAPMDAYDRSLDRFERGLRGEVQAPSGMLTVLRAVLKKSEHRLEEMLTRR
ncbi:MAG TPA: hypothetical protein VF179_23305 [Thermoanaerobaculia bacterium]|nr:hypothetical protein [Thermoanaerobaculia bacterium]